MLLFSLLLSATSAYLDLERVDIDIPQIGTDVIVECEGDRIQATVMKSYIDRNEKWLGNGDYLSLDIDRYNDIRACAGTRDSAGNIVLSVSDDFTRCGMTIESEYEVNEDGIEVVKAYKFINHVYNQDSDIASAADRQLDIVQFECVYPVVQMTTGTMNPLVKSAVSASKTKEIVGDMRLYMTSNYTSFYTSPPVLSLEEVLYVEVNLERPLISDAFEASTDFAVVMEHCWGTPSQSRDARLKYFIIKNQCAVGGDASLNVESNGLGLQGRFNIKMFKFIGEEYNDIWLHCTVRACNTTAGSCVPDCEDGKSKRSADAPRELPFVSFSKDIFADLPIQRMRTDLDEELRIIQTEGSNSSVLTPGSMPFNVLIAIVSIVLVLIFVFGISYLVANRRQPLK